MSYGEIIVCCRRGVLDESLHLGHIAVTDTSGNVLYQSGNPYYMTYARSTVKPLQAIPLIEAGGAGRFGLDDSEIAVICASHSGELPHLEAVCSILHKIGLDPSHLLCGVQAPFHKPSAEALLASGQQPTNLHNNCSGKHAGMLALSRILDVASDHYDHPDHPVQRMMRETVASMCGIIPERIITGIDGCGVPVFGLPLDRLAFSFAVLGTPPVYMPHMRAEACRRIIASLRRQPFYLGGTDRFDTEVIRVTDGRIIGKMGAEGVYALTIPGESIGAAVKITDGASRALYPAVVEMLSQLELLGKNELNLLQMYHRPSINNRHDKIVGSIEPEFRLVKN